MIKLKKTMALLLALAMVLTAFGAVTVSAASFSDTNGHWAESIIDKWSSAGVVNGYSDGTFLPDNNITRAELAKVIATARQYTATAEISFSDVAAGDWYADSLAKCVAQGVIGGYEDGTFRPDNNVTREEAAAMFQRAYQVNAHGLITFADSADISSWAQTSVTALVGSGVINGYEDGTFKPANSITRAEVVKILDGITAVGTEPGSTVAPGGNQVSSGSVVNGGLGGSANGGGYVSGGGGGGSAGSSSYTVTFDSNGGVFDNNKTTRLVSVSKGSIIGNAEPSVTRVEVVESDDVDENGNHNTVEVNYILDGWYTSKYAADNLLKSEKWDIDRGSVTKNMTLYAGWYKEGTVSVAFETNGGTPQVASQSLEVGGYALRPDTVPVREHYTFLGWYESNTASSQFDFGGTPIRTNTTIYARWSVDPEFASQEITLPTQTVGSYQNGTVIASPASALPGETVSLKIVGPAGYYATAIKNLSYTNLTGEKKIIKEKESIAYGIVTFVMPDDVLKGSITVEAVFEHGETATPPPPGTPAPTATPEPEGTVIEYISDKIAAEFGTEFPSGTNYNGLTVSGKVTLSDSSKTFKTGLNIETGETVSTGDHDYADHVFDERGYSKRFRVDKLITKVKVYGPCNIRIDAVSTNSDSTRKINIKVGKKDYGSFVCEGGNAVSCLFSYDGSEGETEMTITPADAVQLYGIILDYGDFVIPTPTPRPTPDPTIIHKITASASANGTVTASTAESVYGETITIQTQPNDGYKAISLVTNPVIPTTNNGDGSFSFTMPASDISVTARIVPENGEEHLVSVQQPDVGGTVAIEPPANYIAETLIDTSEDFMLQDKTGGGWIVSGDGIAPGDPAGDPTAYESYENIYKNETYKMVVADKGVQYVLGTPLGKGPFTLSYDMFITGAEINTFRTYFDNAAQPFDADTGKATATGNDGAFFHMADINNRLFVTKDVSDLTATGKTTPRSGLRIGKNEFENNKWYRFVITGNLGDDTVKVESYRHSLTGDFEKSLTSKPENSTDAAPFVTGRDKSLKQLRFESVNNAMLYYDNIKLVNYNDQYYRAYAGDQFKVTADNVSGYELSEIVVTDEKGNKVPVETNSDGEGTFVMPESSVKVSAVYVPETPADPPEGLMDITDDYAFLCDEVIKGDITRPRFYDDNTFYLSGGNTFAGQGDRGDNTIGSYGAHRNVTAVNADKSYMAFRPAFDAVVTVYSEKRTSLTIIAGVRPGSSGLYEGPYNEQVHKFTVPAGTCVFVSARASGGAGQNMFVAGVTVEHASTAAAADLDENGSAEFAEEPEAVVEPEVEDAVLTGTEDEAEVESEAEAIEAQDETEEPSDLLPTPDEAAQAE